MQDFLRCAATFDLQIDLSLILYNELKFKEWIYQVKWTESLCFGHTFKWARLKPTELPQRDEKVISPTGKISRQNRADDVHPTPKFFHTAKVKISGSTNVFVGQPGL